MLPTLVAEDVRRALTDYLGTTFALGDDDVREELQRFVADPDQGVFRGPFVRLRLPFRPAADGWQETLDWSPAGFVPHRHQAQAWARLSSRGRTPEPTMVTTGTGSGKTESFLVPLLDHCRRHADEPGIKALVLYPMNALASDQARRVAELVAKEHDLADVRVGLYTGDKGTNAAMTADEVITDRQVLRDDPPDILLTNYKMLDFLLLRSEDAELWRRSRESLRYLVLDEFHTYDGAQGTDVAMLLRRLGMTLDVARPGRPLGDVVPVATSATLGGRADGEGTDGGRALRDFAATVFGCEFTPESIVGEDRLTPDEWMTADERGPVPILDSLTAAVSRVREEAADGPSHGALLRVAADAFLADGEGDRVDLAEHDDLAARLRAHPLTRRLLSGASTPRPLDDLAVEVEPSWDPGSDTRRVAARDALALFLALLSHTRVDGGRPLLGVDVQLWAREVSRLERRLSSSPGFRWHDAAPRSFDDDRHLPSVYCRHCGRSGWAALRQPAGEGLEGGPDLVWRGSTRHPRRVRALLFAPGEAARGAKEARWIEPETLEFVAEDPGRHSTVVPVIATPDDEAAKADRCPSCSVDDGIRFLGSRVTTLASAALGHVFGSDDVPAGEKKTLVFTDSVQDASHRAAFVEARVYALNLRALLHRAIPSWGTTLEDMGERLVEAARSPGERHALLPPDLKDHVVFRRFWADDVPTPATLEVIRRRMGFSALLEFGLSSRVGRTLELTGAVTAYVDAGTGDDLAAVAERAVDRVHRDTHQLPLDGAGPSDLVAWVRGLLERLRSRGGVDHTWWEQYIAEDGGRFPIWGGRPRTHGMPAFPSGRAAPAFPTTARHSDAFDPVGSARGRYATWTGQVLGVPVTDAPRYVRALFDELARAGVVEARTTKSGVTVWVIPPARVRLERTADVGRDPSILRCTVCATRFPGPESVIHQLDGAPCQRDRCPGHYRGELQRSDYYRALYRSGAVRRIVAREHTSLLDGDDREALERAFTAPPELTDPEAPNVLACTPTLELGIDIGDLSLVTLTSLPRSTASYLQRVGRAGRSTGNALILSLLPGRPLELQRLTDPLTMIAGEVVPPACYLDATEILRRQYLASLIDRLARNHPSIRPREARDVLGQGTADGSWLGNLLDAAAHHATLYTGEFLAPYGEHLSADTAAALRAWAGVGGVAPSGLRRSVEVAVERWHDERAELDHRIGVIVEEIEKLQAMDLDTLGDVEQRAALDLKRLQGEARVARRQRKELESGYWVSALEALGLLPNYALRDDSTRLDVNLWWTDEDSGRSEQSDDRYDRGSRTALRELAPGATFYARGSAVTVDGLDLGTSRNPAMVDRRFCPACGWSVIVREGDAPRPCARCGAAAAADSGQVLRTLPFRGASAYAGRDRSRSYDLDDERRRTSFAVLTTVDVDPSEITTAWRNDGYPFGVEVARTGTVRWTNVGPLDRGGPTLTLGGERSPAPLFTACRYCGVVWSAQIGVSGPAEARHRGWCRQRKEPDPAAWLDLALTHELETQVVRMLVPPIVTADPTLLTSFRAALRLGLREVIGGDPDHLDVVTAHDPDPTGDRWLMVLHDLVPGGTGYLARFGEPERTRELLGAALDRLVSSPCADEPVAACHRCLLPYAAPAEAGQVRRDRVVALLEEILTAWSPSVSISALREIAVGPHETPIERRFRDQLVGWARSTGAVSEGTGERLRLSVAEGVEWQLEPQVLLGKVQPDYLLTCSDVSAPRVAVFCDGAAFHSSTDVNRLADDAAKRSGLREDGYVVWAVTHQDLDEFAGGPPGPSWLSDTAGTVYRQLAPRMLTPGSVEVGAPLGSAMEVLTRFLKRPRREAWQRPVQSLVVSCAGGSPKALESTTPEGVAVLAAQTLLGEATPPPPGPMRYAVYRSPGGAAIGLGLGSSTSMRAWAVVDDRPGVVGSEDQQRTWRDWLAASNVLQLLAEGGFTALTTTSAIFPVDPLGAVDIDVVWAEVLGVVAEGAHALASELAVAHTEVAVAGHEVDDGEYEIDLAWPDRRIAVVLREHPDRDSWLVDHGWTIVPPEPDVVRAALTGGAVGGVVHTAADPAGGAR